MNAGTPPEPGASRIELRTYRVDPDGRRAAPAPARVHTGVAPPAVPDMSWPPCRCPRCRTGTGPGTRNDPPATPGTQDRAERFPPAQGPTEEDHEKNRRMTNPLPRGERGRCGRGLGK